ncbi:MAG TPA: HEAT repeat domain-containing protein [Verrucomicrobiae bacterium]|nr:HEAT repeat domain-containing protein [Verrucomicrobiae bacterium]
MRKVLVIFAVAAFLGALAWRVAGRAEPQFEGRPVSAWLLQLDYSNRYQDRLEAARAVRALGTNTLPAMLRFIAMRDGSWKEKALRLARKQKWINISWREAVKYRVCAVEAFAVLGETARPARPRLLELLRDENAEIRKSVLRAFLAMGLEPTDLAVFIACLKDDRTRSEAADALGTMGPLAASAVPDLLGVVWDTNGVVRVHPVRALGRIHAQPKAVVPVLIKLLSDPDSEVRNVAAISLGDFGPEAKDAVPSLRAGLQRGRFADSIGAALNRIDPEAAEKAGVPYFQR